MTKWFSENSAAKVSGNLNHHQKSNTRLTVDAGIAGAGRTVTLFLLRILVFHLLFLSESTGHIRGLVQLELGGHPFGRAIDDMAILHKALDQPVAVARAVTASVYASLAQIIVTVIADVAVVVLVRHRSVANVAIDGPRVSWRDYRFDFWTNREVTLAKWLYHIVAVASAERVWIRGRLGR